MLRVTISRNAEGAIKYFSEALSREDYYLGKNDVEAVYRGKAAQILGIEGKVVTKESFSKLVKQIHPLYDTPLSVRKVDRARAAYEYCFNVPKSISILYAITQDKEILKAHQNAVAQAMAEIEADMQTQANRDGKKYYETTGNIVYAAFDHFTSRPNEEVKDGQMRYVADCHLHTHAFMFNATWNENLKRFQAIEEGNVRRVASYYEAIYHSVLSKGMVELGYGIRTTPDRYEVSGVTRDQIERFSNRTMTIERLAKERGITSARKKAELGALSRNKKDKSVPENQLHDIWRDRLSDKELRGLHNLKSQQGQKDTRQISAKEAVARSLDHFLERNSVVPEKRVLGHALTLGYGMLDLEKVKKALKERTDIIGAEYNTVRHITTREVLKAEEGMISWASRGKGSQAALYRDYEPKQDFLNAQQKQAIKHILTSRDRVKILMGAAGVGKTSLLTEVRYALAERNRPLFACAPSAEASTVLKKKGFDNADTIAALLHNKTQQEKLRNGVLLIDEAGMVGVKTMNQLFQVADAQNARVILSGDTRQHASVESGDGLRLIHERSQIQAAHVKQIVRQASNEPYRKAIQDLARGETLQGYQKLSRLDAVREVEDEKDRHEQIATDYLQSLNEKRSALVVSPTHREGDEITKVIRDRLKQTGKITGREKTFKNQRTLSFTEDQKQHASQYTEGMVVQFHQNIKGGIKAGQKYEVSSISERDGVVIRSLDDGQLKPLPVEHHKNFNVFRQSEITVAQGDLIRITHNGKTIEKSKINNGQTYTVKGFDKLGNIKLSNGKTLDKNYRNFSHAHVLTSHASQGKDAKDVYLSMSTASAGGINEKSFYVGVSRGTERIKIYTDDKDELKKAIVRNSDRTSASELADKARKERQQRQTRINYHNRLNKEQRQYERSISKNERGISEPGEHKEL
ncbi:MAG: relaxase domain-containing protein [Bacteroidia bacterium]|nr:relaxase domain-containing protein [Bacteroidia bacterium]